MNLLIKILKVSVIFTLSLGVIGCSSIMHRVVTTQEEFIKVFEHVVNANLQKQQNLWNDFEKFSTYTKDDYKNDIIQVLQHDIDIINKNKNVIKDKSLQTNIDKYIRGIEKKIDSLNTSNEEISYLFENESNQLKKECLISMVQEYGVKIKDYNKNIYNEIIDNTMTVNKENESDKYADILAKEIIFDEQIDNFGDVTFLGVFENTSKLNFDKLSIKVEYKDKTGEVVYNDYILIKHFLPGTKKNIKLSPYENKVVSVNLVTDWYEIR